MHVDNYSQLSARNATVGWLLLSWELTCTSSVALQAVICSGMAYYLQGSVMQEKGPVFVTAFSPLDMILVVIVGLLFLGEDLFLGGLVLPFILTL